MRQELGRLSASNAVLEIELRSTNAELAACRGSRPEPSAEPDMLGLMRKEMAAFQQSFRTLTANKKLLKANPPLTSGNGDHHGVQCINMLDSRLLRTSLAALSSATSRSYAAVAARTLTSSGQIGA
ncbi:hypothetical protein SFRURICE_003513 [Spodoptera frugiperda]|nr:hypothetical protein SFRURICE_003513 [Spodoptera frugiperda]